jgi:hypothetical protein
MNNTITCGHCDTAIADQEVYADDSGEYHQDCQDAYNEQEQRTWGAQYRATAKPAQDDHGYDWGDPKNSAYIEWATDQADAR